MQRPLNVKADCKVRVSRARDEVFKLSDLYLPVFTHVYTVCDFVFVKTC